MKKHNFKNKKVKNFSVGDIVMYDGKRCEIVGFSTRQSVLIKNLEYGPADFSTAKVSVQNIADVIEEAK